MTILSVTGVSLRFGVATVLENISFSLNEGDRLGIIGVNGAGKTSLLKIIAGEQEPTEGAVYLSRQIQVGYLEQNAVIDEEEASGTVLDYMFRAHGDLLKMERRQAELEAILSRAAESAEGMSAAAELSELSRRYAAAGGLEFRGRCASFLQKTGFSEADFSLPLSSLSGGQRTRLSLARILCREPDLLMLDEPTNHLDIATLEWLESFLSGYKKTVLVISHDRYFLDNVTNRTLHIERCQAKLYNGNYSFAQRQREEDRAAQEKKYKLQQREIERIEVMIAQQRHFAMERNFITIRSKEKMIDRMEKVERPAAELKSMRLSFSAEEIGGNDVLRAEGLSKAFDGREPLFSDASFLIRRGERVFFTGPNGCGKSTLLKILTGKLPQTAGRFELGYNIKIGYYDQENQQLDPGKTVLEELWSAYPSLTQTEVRNTLASFLFCGDDVMKTVSLLSGGERARLTLSKLILSRVNLLVLDEPTNHLDIGSREALEGALQEYPGTILAVSHDRYFIDRLATRILEFVPGAGGVCRLENFPIQSRDLGAYREYTAERTRRLAAAAGSEKPQEKPISSAKEEYLDRKQAQAEERRKKRQLEKLREEMAALEQEIAEIDKELFGEAATDYVRAAELDARKTQAEERLLEIYGILG